MNLFSRAELKTLLEIHEWPCISLYIPTFHAGPQVLGNAVRYKKLLSEAESHIIEKGMSAPKAREFLHEARQIHDDISFWQHQLDGFVLLLAPGIMAHRKLPYPVEEHLAISDRFCVKPILPAFTNNGRFYILALSKSWVRLYRASRYEMTEVELPDVPRSLAEAMKYEDYQKLFTFHQSQGPTTSGGGHAEIRHGSGGETDYEKNEILRFFQMVNPAVQKAVLQAPGPVVLAGVEYMQAIYREADGRLGKMDEWVDGHPESFSIREIHERAWNIVAPVFRQDQISASAAFLELSNRENGGNRRAWSDIARVLIAGRDGRVQFLFIPLNSVKWGHFETETGEVRFDDVRKHDSEDLFERAAIETFVTGGDVYAVQPEEMPGRRPIAAVLRY
jgi:hypothetical protein